MTTRARRLALSLALVAAGALAPGSSAAAHPVGAPKTVLYTGTDAQTGRLVSAQWSGFDGSFCVTQISDGSSVFPTRGVPWKPGSKIKIQLRKRHRPDQLTIRSWDRLQNARPVGQGELLSHELHRSTHKGRRIWVAVFTPETQRHLYFRIRGTWIDTSPCGGIQMATWQFHARKVS